MKINVRLLLLTFTIVVLISVSSALIFYSLTNKIITNQNDQSVLNATNDFIFSFQQLVENIELDFKRIVTGSENLNAADLTGSELDYIFTLKNVTDINFDNFKVTDKIDIKNRYLSLSRFLKDNPNTILKYEEYNGETYYYGKVISDKLLDRLSEKIRANILLVVDNTPMLYSGSENQEPGRSELLNAIDDLRFKNKFDIYRSTLENSDFYATYYAPTNILTDDSKLGFIIYQTSPDAAQFRSTSGFIGIIIIVAGIALSLILVLLVTSGLRKQITDLNYAAEITSKGNFDYRVKINSKDEIGNLGFAFNHMLDVLKHQKEAEKDYTEFITLINENPSLNEISEAAVNKIIRATGVSFGILYHVENKELHKPLASYGIKTGVSEESRKVDYYKNAIENKETIEFKFRENNPVIKTGLAEIKIKYILIVPIIYSGEVVAIIELASEKIPDKNVRSYIENIREQLAIGIINGTSFEKMKQLVNELKKLNTDYQQQNDELRRLHLELKSKAEELDEQRLKALENTKLKSQFLANMTHELKTPLNSILGLSDLIQQDGSLPEVHRNRLKVVVRNSKKLLNLINNILEFSRAEAGKLSVKNEQFLLSNLLDEINAFIKPYAEDKQLDYFVETEGDYSILLDTDKVKLEQILINLLNNAIKFTEKGYIKLEISFPRDSDILFSVVDTGIGISDKSQEVIFEEFRQADGTTARQYDGTGLGLSICKRFTELLQGEFNVESRVNQGSRFTVVLKNVIVEKVRNITDEEEQDKAQRKVLLVSPFQSSHELYGDYFKLNHYRTVSAYDYSDAMKYINDEEVDIITANNIISEKTGWELLAEVKASHKNYGKPFIVISLADQSNYGYGLAVYDYLNDSVNEEQVKFYLDNIARNKGMNNLEMVSFSSNNKLNNLLKNDYAASIENLKNQFEKCLFTVSKNKPDVLFIDLINDNGTSVKLIDVIKHNRELRSTEIIGLIPASFTSFETEELNRDIKDVLFEHKHHTLDVLKIFRQRLGIRENEEFKSRLIDEDNSSRGNDGKGNIIEAETGPVEEPEVQVLVVDDDSDALFTVGEIIKNIGYKPVFAKNGVECLLTLNHIQPDLILLDIMMPQMDGFQTIKEIRKLDNCKDIPVVALTAYAMLDDKDIIGKNGFKDIITKPINSAELSIKIQKYLGIQV